MEAYISLKRLAVSELPRRALLFIAATVRVPFQQITLTASVYYWKCSICSEWERLYKTFRVLKLLWKHFIAVSVQVLRFSWQWMLRLWAYGLWHCVVLLVGISTLTSGHLPPFCVIWPHPLQIHFNPEDGGSLCLWNVGIHLQHYMVSQLRRPQSTLYWWVQSTLFRHEPYLFKYLCGL